MGFTLLAPDIVEGSVEGSQPEGMTLPRLIGTLHPSWTGQRIAFDSQSSFSPSTSATLKANGCQRCADMARNPHDHTEASTLPSAR